VLIPFPLPSRGDSGASIGQTAESQTTERSSYAMSETSLNRALLQYLRYHPKVADVWRNNTGGAHLPGRGGKQQFVKFSRPGISDILGFLKDGRFLAVEGKVGRNKPTPAQEEFIRRVRAAGGVGIIAYSVDDVERGLR